MALSKLVVFPWAATATMLETRTFRRYAILLLLVGVLTSCSFFIRKTAQQSPYQTVWSTDSAIINMEVAAYAATASSPGACNKGSAAGLCQTTDLATIRDLTAFRKDLAKVQIPPSYRVANSMFSDALQLYIKGLNERVESLTSDGDALFTEGQNDIAAAHAAIGAAYQLFPTGDRPQPAPII